MYSVAYTHPTREVVCAECTHLLPSLRYYLYQWPVTMSIIVVISIFVTLCTCTVLIWVRDVIRDYDLQRRRGLQRRRAAAAAQLQRRQPRPVRG